MKNRFLSLILAVALVFSSFLISCNKEPSVTAFSVNEAECELYFGDIEKSIALAFEEGCGDIPMISLDEGALLLSEYITENRDPEYSLTVESNGNEISLVRDNGFACIFDADKGTLTFDDYNAFNMFSFELGALDILEATGFDEEGEPEYFQRVMCGEKPGRDSVIDLKEREIPCGIHNNKGYITLQTFSDIFLAPHEIMISYSNDRAFLLDGDLLGAREELYFSEGAVERSEKLIDMNYKQLCLLIDFHYGLKDEHGIFDADEYIEQTGVKDMLYSEDPVIAFSGLKTLVYKYLSDNHTNVLMHSPANAEPSYSLSAEEASVGYWEFYKNYLAFTESAQEQLGKEKEQYREIGNTAFISFDSFTSTDADYYTDSPVEGEYYDEIGLISYAHAMIKRENSPIENVVIDLGANTGGHMDGGIYLTAWVLGNAVLHIDDPIRGGEGTFIYRADVDLNRVFDANDTISDKNIYLLTSPISFSCSNYVANAFKESGKVTVIGTATGGGASCVYFASMTDGSALSISSTMRMCSYKNGSYYSLDEGVLPDYKLTNPFDIFNYEKIAKMVNSMH